MKRFNVCGMQGNRDFLRNRGVEFETSNPTLQEIKDKVSSLSNRGKKKREVIELLEKLTGGKLEC